MQITELHPTWLRTQGCSWLGARALGTETACKGPLIQQKFIKPSASNKISHIESYFFSKKSTALIPDQLSEWMIWAVPFRDLHTFAYNDSLQYGTEEHIWKKPLAKPEAKIKSLAQKLCIVYLHLQLVLFTFNFKFYTGPRTMNNFIFICLEILLEKNEILKYFKLAF